MKWKTSEVMTDSGPQPAIAPEIISASRATDIPAFHAEWFMQRLDAGYVRWVNPFNQRPMFVSFENLRAIVFWTKNAAPMLPWLPALDARHISYYFQFTVNDYAAEGLEPQLPPLAARMATFRELAQRLGRERVVWRFDPLILAEGLDPETLLARVAHVGASLHEYTTQLTFSFADIAGYARVVRRLRAAGVRYREFTRTEMLALGRGIGVLCGQWGITPATCAEEIDLEEYGVEKSRCIDDARLLAISHNDPALVKLFGYRLEAQLELSGQPPAPTRPYRKDPGQRKACGCVISKDIGWYDSCGHGCVYCYAGKTCK